jgi:hypothetical protein
MTSKLWHFVSIVILNLSNQNHIFYQEFTILKQLFLCLPCLSMIWAIISTVHLEKFYRLSSGKLLWSPCFLKFCWFYLFVDAFALSAFMLLYLISSVTISINIINFISYKEYLVHWKYSTTCICAGIQSLRIRYGSQHFWHSLRFLSFASKFFTCANLFIYKTIYWGRYCSTNV